MKTTFIFIFVLVILGSCQNDPKIVSPKETLINWQKMVDEGHFAEAAKLSTPSTIQWMESLEDMYDASNPTEITIFHDINCSIESDTATCSYVLFEEQEKLSVFTQLAKVKGVWLVDIDDD